LHDPETRYGKPLIGVTISIDPGKPGHAAEPRAERSASASGLLRHRVSSQ
jgi:hypothetical protein